MTHQAQAAATDRLRRAILAFQAAESFFLNAHRRMKIQPQAGAEAYWAGPGQRIKEDLRTAATEVDDACNEVSAGGLGIGTADRRIIAAAKQYLVELT